MARKKICNLTSEKPLASVTRILEKGGTQLSFSRKLGCSYIKNTCTGRNIQLTEEKGTFVMDVEYFEPDVDAEGFYEAAQRSRLRVPRRLRDACKPWRAVSSGRGSD